MAATKKGRRPPLDIYEQTRRMAEAGSTIAMIGRILFGVGELAMLQRLEADPKLDKVYKDGAARTNNRLIETAYNLAPKLAKRGNVGLLIFLLKTKCGFREVHRIEGEIKHNVTESFAKAVQEAPASIRDTIGMLTPEQRETLQRNFAQAALPDGMRPS